MPSLVRKLVILAGTNGIILQPLGVKKIQASQIAYTSSSIGLAPKDEVESESLEKGFEAFGVVG